MDAVSRILAELEETAEGYKAREKKHALHRNYGTALEYWARWHALELVRGWIRDHRDELEGKIECAPLTKTPG